MDAFINKSSFNPDLPQSGNACIYFVAHSPESKTVGISLQV